MAVFLLDTDILSLYQRKHPKVTAAISAHGTDTIVISTITIDEQIGGWSALSHSAKSAQNIEHCSMFLAALVDSWKTFAIVPFNVPAIARFDGLVKAKLNVKRNDLRIAAIALELGGVIVTRNRRDFGRVASVVIEDWSV